MNSTLILTGIEGSNPLGFLAALGTLRVLTLCGAGRSLRMHWEACVGAWRPVLSSDDGMLDEDSVIGRMIDFVGAPPQVELLEEIGPDLTISGRRLRFLTQKALADCERALEIHHLLLRARVDFVAAFGCDASTVDGEPDSLIQDTALRTMSGAGHQHFIAFMRELIVSTNADHLRTTLFTSWTYKDPGRGANLRWDPGDDRRYALRWKNPSGDPNTTVRGANRLAIEALPLFTTAPDGDTLQTTGFAQRRREGVRWTWPLWSAAINLDTVRGLLQSSEVQPPPAQAPQAELQRWRSALAVRGIAAVFQSQRITTGKYRNFTPARAL